MKTKFVKDNQKTIIVPSIKNMFIVRTYRNDVVTNTFKLTKQETAELKVHLTDAGYIKSEWK